MANMNRNDLPETTGTVYYIKPSDEDLYTYVYKGEHDAEKAANGKPTSNLERIETEVRVRDMRGVADDFSLKENGVVLRTLRVPGDIDWANKDEVATRYYPLAEELLKRETGATRVHIFDHTLRQGHVSSEREEDIPGKPQRLPVGLVHVDYTTKGGLNRLKLLFPEEYDKLSKVPFSIAQIWRPLRGPVESSPLGVIDAATVDKEDYLNYTIHFPGRTGYNYGLKKNPQHRWYYAKGINTNEAYVFVCYDSRGGRARFTPHTGFRDHSAGPEAAERESIELRALCFYEKDGPQEPAHEL